VPVKFNKNINGMSLYPNPVNAGGTVNIEFKDLATSKILVVLRDMSGREFYSKIFINIENGQLIGVPIKQTIPKGVYIIIATSENQIYSQRIVVQ